MKVLVEDANVLLDLVSGGVLGIWLDTDYEHCTTSLVWHEIASPLQKGKVQPFIDSKQLIVYDVRPTDWKGIAAFAAKANISISDASVWSLAKGGEAIILSGDSKLRKTAKAAGIEVRGIFWVLDQLVLQNAISPNVAAGALRKMVSGGAFLPAQECGLKITRWTAKRAAQAHV